MELFESFPTETRWLSELNGKHFAIVIMWYGIMLWTIEFFPFQDRNMDMRSLEHCLNDITNTAGVQSDLKGELVDCFSEVLNEKKR